MWLEIQYLTLTQFLKKLIEKWHCSKVSSSTDKAGTSSRSPTKAPSSLNSATSTRRPSEKLPPSRVPSPVLVPAQARSPARAMGPSTRFCLGARVPDSGPEVWDKLFLDFPPLRASALPPDWVWVPGGQRQLLSVPASWAARRASGFREGTEGRKPFRSASRPSDIP